MWRWRPEDSGRWHAFLQPGYRVEGIHLNYGHQALQGLKLLTGFWPAGVKVTLQKPWHQEEAPGGSRVGPWRQPQNRLLSNPIVAPCDFGLARQNLNKFFSGGTFLKNLTVASPCTPNNQIVQKREKNALSFVNSQIT